MSGMTSELQRFSPRDVHCKQHRDIGEQRKRGEFEDGSIALIVEEDFEQQGHGTEQQGVENWVAPGQELQRRAHRAQVGAKVDHVGDEQQAYREPQQRLGVVPAQIGGDPPARNSADLGGDALDYEQQREAEDECPRQRVAELSSDLTVRANAAGIVVGSAGDKTWAKARQEGITVLLLRHPVFPL